MLVRPLVRDLVRPVLRLPTQRGGLSSPVAAMFAGGRDGAWYEQNLNAIYQDSAGTTAGALEQPEGLVLDRRFGYARGAESRASAAPALIGAATAATYNTSTGVGTATRVDVSNRSIVYSSGLAANTFHEISVTCTGGQSTNIRDGAGSVQKVVSVGQTATAIVSTLGGNIGIDAATAGETQFVINSLRPVSGNHATQSTSASRPQSKQDASGFNYAQLDGADDYWTGAAGGGGTAAFFLSAAIRVIGGAGTNRTIWSDAGTNTGRRVRINSSNQLEIAAGNGAAFTTVNTTDTLSAGSSYVITCWHDGTNLGARVNLATAATGAFGTATAGTTSFTIGRDNGAASSYANIGIYSMEHLTNTCPDASLRDAVARYNASKMGLSL